MSDIDKLALEIADKVFDVGGDTRSLRADVARLGILEGERRGMEKAAAIAEDHVLTADDDVQRAYSKAAIDIETAIRKALP